MKYLYLLIILLMPLGATQSGIEYIIKKDLLTIIKNDKEYKFKLRKFLNTQALSELDEKFINLLEESL